MEFPEMRCLDGSWTNEKHISFLNWMEASFVKRMLKNDDFVDGDARLDRYLPDSAESTLDFDCGRNGKRVHEKRGSDERRRRRDVVRERSSRRDNDQVVPQMENMKCKRTDREEREELQIAVNTR
ncbi:hypothetical protein CKAN_01551800 [Cinnamomum micranthum f. kanehirae]|uniref:Uncharacterized protein n=1 Tax=Cinnamomum micranthum f. kanehirae TaxID=337451 RepID=A0A3S3QM65_9MAGN|nr:hypothetical protein CKAN_01551800 [Cinnamomum micranthum f. kanehirae]